MAQNAKTFFFSIFVV